MRTQKTETIITRAWLLIVAAIVLALSAAPAGWAADNTAKKPDQQAGKEKTAFVPNEILIHLKPERAKELKIEKDNKGKVVSSLGSLNRLHAKHGAVEMERLYPVEQAKPKKPLTPVAQALRQKLGDTYRIRFEANINVQSVMREYAQDENVELAEPNHVFYVESTFPNDPLFPQQWALDNTGQMGGRSDADIDAPEAWDSTTGSASVVVAVIDTGVDWNHPDLAANIWINTAEIPGNGLDDDGNGFIDDVRGWDFVSLPTASVYPGEDGAPRDNDPRDFQGHGTLVSGVVAALGNNGIGVAGVSWKSKIMAVRAGFKSASGGGEFAVYDIAASLIYAADNGANIINMSFAGGSAAGDSIKSAIQYAAAQGALLVAGAGNSGTEFQFYPAAFDEVISVAATDRSDDRAYFSTFGNSTELAAPGDTIWTTQLNGTYAPASGTSLSSPYVCGVAALILSKNPTLTSEQLRQVLRTGADDLGAVGWDPYFGYGRVNANQSVGLGQMFGGAEIQTPRLDEIVGGQVQVIGTASAQGFQSYELLIGPGLHPATWIQITTSSTPVINGTLGLLDTLSLVDGRYSLKLVVRTAAREEIDLKLIFVENARIEVGFPHPQSVLRQGGVLAIQGSVVANQFSSFAVEWADATNPTAWQSTGMMLAGGGGTPISNGTLAHWDTSSLRGTGDYNFRVVVNYGAAIREIQEVEVHLDSTIREGWPRYAYNISPVQFADLDGNNSADLVAKTTDYDSSGAWIERLMVWQQDGTVLRGWPIPAGWNPLPSAIGDLDNACGPEIVSIDGLSITVVANDGTVYPGWPQVYNLPGSRWTPPVLSDVDHDGDLEIFAGGGHLFAAHHDGRLLAGWPLSGESTSPAIGDLDGNGELEIVFVARNKLNVVDQNGQSLPNWPVTLGSTGKTVPTLGDLNKDGELEIVVGLDNCQVVAFNRHGQVLPGWPVLMEGQVTGENGLRISPILADLDQDGFLEVINHPVVPATVYVWNHQGKLLPNWPKALPFFRMDLSPVVGDIDGDGYPDIVTSGEMLEGFERIYALDHRAEVLAGFPKLMSPSYYFGVFYSPVLGDLDNDGYLELAVAMRGPPDELYVWNLGVRAEASRLEWPMAGGNLWNTSNYRDPEFTRKVGRPNTPPTISKIGDQVTNEDVVIGPVSVIVGDNESPLGTLTLNASSSNPALVADGNVIFGGSGANRTVTITPSANQSGVATITVRVCDGSASTWERFVLTVSPVNDPPIGTDRIVTINEDTTYTFRAADYGFSDPNDDPANASLAVKISSLPSAGSLTMDGIAVSAGDFVSLDTIPLGATWTARASNRNWRSIASSADGTKLVAVVTGGQIYTSADSGVSWAAREGSRNWRAVASSTDGTKLVAAVDGGQIYTSTDSGANWTARESNRPWWTVASSADGTKLVAGVWGGQIYTSTDSGASWTAHEASRNWSSVASSADGTKLIATVFNGFIYTSTDSGVNWTVRQSNSSQIWQAVASSADGTMLAAVVGSGQIYTSTDSGVSWTARASKRDWICVTSSRDGSKLVAGVWGGQVYLSSDFGVTWTPSASNLLWSSLASSGDGLKVAATVAFGGQIYSSSGVAGLVFTPVPDANGSPYASFTFQVLDDGGRANGGVDLDPSLKTMTINVVPVSGPVRISDIANQIINEDGSTGAIGFMVEHDEMPADNITVSAHSSNPVLVPLDKIVLGGSGGNRTVTISPSANKYGSAIVTLSASDGSATASDRFVLTVNAVNDPPTFAKGPNQSVLEDSGSRTVPNWVTAISSGPSDEDAQTVSFNVSTDNPALFAVSPQIAANGTLSYTPAGNANGVAIASVNLKDNGGTANSGVDTSVIQTFTITIQPVNDPPAGSNNSVTTLEDTAYAFTSADFVFSDPNDNPPNSLLALQVMTLPLPGSLTLDGIAVSAGDFVSLDTIPLGATWTARESNRNWRSIASSGDGTKLVAVAAGGQIYTSADSGVSWAARESSRNWRAVASSADGARLAAAVDGGQIYTSTDSGLTWTARESNRPWWTLASSADGTKLVAGTWGGQIYTSTDSGVSWTARESNRNWSSVASSADGTKLVATVFNGFIYTSIDSGVNWTVRQSNSSKIWQAVASSADGTKLIAVVGSGQIYTSTDSGASWTARASSREWTSVACSSDGAKLVASVWGGQIYISTDFGVSWAPSASNRLWSSMASSADGLKVAGTVALGGQIYSSRGVAGLVFTPVPDRNGSPYAAFTFQVQDDGGRANGGVDLDPSPKTMTINVAPLNHAPTISNIADQIIDEDNSTSAIVFAVGDVESAVGELMVNASSSNPTLISAVNIVFGGNDANRTVMITPAPNQHGVATITVSVSDGSLSASDSFILTVNSVNDAPTITNIADQSINEDSSTSAIAFTISDVETPAANLTVSANSSNPALVPVGNIILGGTDGNRTVTITPAANQSGTTTITVTVNDGVANASDSFVLTVNAVNDAPAGANNSVTTPEDTAYTIAAADFGFSDPDDSPANASQAVKITTLPLAGALTTGGTGVNAGDFVSLDAIPAGATWTARASNRSWSAVASSSDGTKLVAVVDGGQIYTSADSGVSWTARESNRGWVSVASSADGTKLVAVAVGSQIYTSTDSGVTWTARETNRNWFSVASASDGIKLVAGVDGGQIYTSTDSGVTWTARESSRRWFSVASSADGAKLVAGVYAGQIYTSTDSGVTWTARGSSRSWWDVASSADGIKLVAVEDGGQIYTSTDSGVTWTAHESARNWISVASSADGTKLVAGVSVVGHIYTSTDSGATWTARARTQDWSSVASSSDGAKLVVVGYDGQIYTSIAVGGLVFTPAANTHGSPYTTFTFQVQDDGGTANGGVNLDPSPNTMTIHVTPVNDAPVLTSVSALTGAAEDTPFNITYSALAGAANEADMDGDVISFRVEAVSSGILLKNGTSVVVGSTLLGIGESLVWITAANANGMLSALTVKAWDGQAASSIAVQVNVSVAAVNDAPTISNIAGQSINEDSSTSAIAFTVADIETPAANLTVSASSSNPTLAPVGNIVFGGTAGNRTVTVTPAANQNGVATITVTVTDGLANASDSFVLTVNAVNDAPTISNIAGQSINEDSSTSAIAFTVADIETPAANLTVSASSSNPTLAPVGNIVFGGTGGNRTVTVTPAANQNGVATITVTVTDGVANASDSFVLTVNPVNDAPSGANISVTTPEDTGYTFASADFGFSDPNDSPASAFQAVKITTLPSAGTLTANGTGVNVGDFVSFDNIPAGTIWTARESNREWYSVASSADGTKLAAVVKNGQIYTSTDSGVNWIVREGSRDWTSIASSSEGTKLVAVAWGGQIYTSTDSGVTWTARASNRYWSSVASSADGTKLVAVAYYPAPGVYTVGGQIYTSTDSGVSWTARESNRNWISVASSADGTKLVAGVNYGKIYTSTDSGVTWTARESNRYWYSVASSADGTKLVAGVNHDKIYTSTDSGVTWTARASNQNYWRSLASSADGTKLVAVVSGGQIYTSTDSGVTWTARESNRNWNSVASSADGTKLVAGVYYGKIYTSSDSTSVAGLVFTPAANASGSPYTTFTFQVQDDGGTANGGVNLDPSPNTMTIHVTPVNAAPTLTSVSALTGATEDTPFTITYAAFVGAANEADVDGDAISFRVETVSSGTVTKNGTPVVVGSTFWGSGENLVWTPVANANGTLNAFTVKAWDGQAASSSPVPVSVSVSAVNDAPTISNIADQLTMEDTATAAISFTVGDVETAASSLAVSGASSNPSLVPSANIVFGGSGANRTVTVTPASNQNGTATITVTVGDGSATTSDSFVLTVNSVNDAPAGADNGVTTLEDTPYTFASADFGFSDPNDNPPNAFLAVKITSLPSAGILTVDGAGVNSGDFVSPETIEAGAMWTARESNRSWFTVASSSDGTKLVAGVDGGQIYTSTDSGVTWTARESNRIWAAVASSADGTKLVAGAYFGQLYTSADSGATWTARENNRNWHSVASSADGTMLVAVAQGGRIYTSTDSGVSWTPRESNRTWRTVASSADGTKLVAVVSNVGQIYTSTDSGVTWTARESVRDWYSVASSADGTKLVAGAFNGQIYTSTDSGVTWTARARVGSWYSVASSTDGTRLVAGAWGSRIYISTDSGVTWTPRESNRNWNAVASSADGMKLVAVVQSGGQIYTSSGAAGLLFTPEADSSGSPYATFTFQVQDDGGTANGGVNLDSSPNTMTIHVTPGNTTPTISNIGDQNINEDSTTGAISFTVADGETPGASLTLSASSSNTALMPDGNIFFGGGGTDRTLTVTPSANQHGVTTITVTVSDGSLSASDSFVVTVNPVNDAPSFAKGADQAVLEDAGPQSVANWATGISAGPPDESGQSLSFHVTSDYPALFSVPPAISSTGTLSYTPAPNASGVATLNVRVKDDGGTALGGADTSNPETFTITVTPINDAPVASPDAYATDEDQVLVVAARGVLANDSDIEGDALSAALVSGPSHGLLNLNPDGSFRYTPVPNFNGTDRFTYKARDATLESAATVVTLVINPVNDPPTVSVNQTSITTPEGTSVSNEIVFADIDGDAVSLTASPGSIASENGRSIWRFQAVDGPLSTQVSITANDGHGGIATAPFALTVNNVAPTVTILGPSVGAVYRVNTPINFAASFTDPGVNDTHTAKWTFSAAGVPDVTVSGTVSDRAVQDTLQFSAAGVYFITLTVTDKDGGSGTAATVNGSAAYIVVFDPNGGFVTGGGWITSLPGALTTDVSAQGKATFGFTAKYPGKKSTPDGNVEFQFQPAKLNFKSSTIDWLVVSGNRAQLKGSGTINQRDGVEFMLTAVDAPGGNGGGADRFRLQIWDRASGTVIYDNQPGASINAQLDGNAVIQSGNIAIH